MEKLRKQFKDKRYHSKEASTHSSEDVYDNWIDVTDSDPEDLTKMKSHNEKPSTMNERDFSDTMFGYDLDVPGSELDDEQEKVGNEDEENNYYSLGGDDHNGLDENGEN